ncbi:unnamed protein product [Rotaria sp. Silwood1]|nr:unnamed protein product [Rotaria sp. Silwood1]CAF1061596.1 unnamed protein product [Rotaria sp. Silwood1]
MSTLLSWQEIIITIHNPSLKTYQKLQDKYSTTLNCPCLINTMSYKQFIIAETTMHQICSSDFISEQWIHALYIPDASRYSAIDFRTTASSQFEVLKTLCVLARDNIFDALFNLNDTQLFSSNLLPEKQICTQTNISSDRILRDTRIRFNNALKLIELSTQSNVISSALNTNIVYSASRFATFQTYMYKSSYTGWYWTENNQTTICVCQINTTCTAPAGFYSFADKNNFDLHTKLVPQQHHASDVVPGFVGSCTPYEAVIEAKFICLYDIKCIKKLVNYFPRLAQLIPTIKLLNASIKSKYLRNITVSQLIQELFLEQWNISIDYNHYYTACAPKMCTYSYRKQANFAYTITMFISVYSGLQTILRFIIPLIVKYILKKRPDIINNNTINGTDTNSVQRSVFLLLLFTTISEQTTSVTYDHPSYTVYKQLYVKYSDKLICSCSKITPNYGSFINITPIYHPVCSSAFVKPIWLDQLRLMKGVMFAMSDWRIMSLGYFQSLAALCELAHNTVNNDLQAFRTRTIVTTRLLNEDLLHGEINNTLKQLIHSMQIEFERVNNILRLLFQVNQYFAGSTYNGQLEITFQSDEENLKIIHNFSRPGNIFQDAKCLCAFHVGCGEPMVIVSSSTTITVPGFVWRCSAMDSILSSTLQCLYSNTNCLQIILLRYINYTNTAVPVPPLNVSQLFRTSINSTVATLADNLFVEEWKTSLSYIQYFNMCVPSICQYTFVRRANYLYVIRMFLTFYGGLTLALSLLVPLIVKLILRCRHQIITKQDNNRERIAIIIRFRTFYQRLSETLKTKITDFNIFQTYSFGRHVDQITRIRLGRLTTRFYICCYAIGLTILILYTSFEQRTVTTKFYNPSLFVAKQLQSKQIGTVDCPCKRASIPLNEFINIQTRFHQICTSTFIKDEWRESLLVDFENLTDFLRISDYRLFLSAHLQFLSGLCYQAIKHVNDTLRSFTSNFLSTSRLLSQSLFDKQLSNLTYQTEAHIPALFVRALESVQAINHGNVLMTVYGSNYKFVARNTRKGSSTLLYTLPTIYNGSENCSCELQSKCLSQAAFTWPHYVKVKGLLVGCLPSESFLASTLECFFDIDCINIIRNHMSGNIYRTRANPLNTSSIIHSRYQINTTVNDLVKNLFMEQWSTNISYDRYFSQCAPNICTYSYIDNANPLHVASTLLGLYGGLTVVLSWWCPQFVELIHRIQTRYKNKRRIGSISSVS